MGDAAAFSELFHRHFASTFAYALHMLDGDRGAAEDAAQGAWVKVWLNASSFRGTAQVRTWVFTIVAREVLDSRRRRRPIVIDPHTLADTQTDHEPVTRDLHAGVPADPEQQILDEELWAALALALSELPWRQRASWLLREFEEMSYDEIARILETSPTVVRGQLHRARRALAIRMEQWR